MFETECQYSRLGSDALPDAVKRAFAEARGVSKIALMLWEEHCTECAWPQCYTSCDLYNPRNDANCRRTVDGFSPVPGAAFPGGRVVRVQFRNWGMLTTSCELVMHSLVAADAAEAFNDQLSRAAQSLPHLGRAIGRPGLFSRLARKAKRQKVRNSNARAVGMHRPNCFLMDIYSPADRSVSLSVLIAPHGGESSPLRFQKRIEIVPGFQAIRIPFVEIAPFLGETRNVFVSVTPNLAADAAEGLTLFFGRMGFAVDSEPPVQKSADKKIKIMVWDLDNTLWGGVLVEDGLGKVALKPGIREVLEALDARGIVNSVASKNDADLALQQLDQFGLKDLFVFPEINWNPKSQSIRQITAAFNVGADTIGFIDDSVFEREEVAAGAPKTRLYPAEDYAALLQRPEFNVPVTEEAKNRRSFYRTEEKRQAAFAHASSDYLTFLKQSRIEIIIEVPRAGQVARIHELVQRTNQLNFSGNRYSRPEIEAILGDTAKDTFLISASDIYGDYGQVGFAIVALGGVPTVVDLAFSCRVQAKTVEHAVLRFLIAHYRNASGPMLDLVFRRSDRNQQVGKALDEVGFRLKNKEGAVETYTYDKADIDRTSEVVTVTFRDSAAELQQP